MPIISPNMNLPVPIVGVDTGPGYAQNIDSSLNIIDQHNHSNGQGVLIQPNGLDISSDLPFNANNATNLRTVRFASQIAPIPNMTPDVGVLYVSGNELWYNDYTGGNQVQITTNGLINATASGIASGTATASFSAGVLVVKSAPTSFANVDLQSVVLSNPGDLINQLTLLAPTLAGSYDLTLPTIPAQTNVMTLDVSGNMGSITYTAVLNGSSNANMGGNAVQENGKNLVVSNANATNSLAVVRGVVFGNGTIVTGEGFSVSNPGTGTYDITFSPAFSDLPSVTANGYLNLSTGTVVSVNSISASVVSVNARALISPFDPVNTGFTFIAIGQRA